MGEATIRVLCVDDHRLMREGIARIVGVQPDMTVVAQASDGEQAVEEFLRVRPDVTLMDLEMPTMRGVQAIHAIRRHEPNARIVVLTMYNGDEDIHRAVAAGAVGYLLKDMLPDDLVRVIREVHSGGRVIPPEIAAALEQRASQPTLTHREKLRVVRPRVSTAAPAKSMPMVNAARTIIRKLKSTNAMKMHPSVKIVRNLRRSRFRQISGKYFMPRSPSAFPFRDAEYVSPARPRAGHA